VLAKKPTSPTTAGDQFFTDSPPPPPTHHGHPHEFANYSFPLPDSLHVTRAEPRSTSTFLVSYPPGCKRRLPIPPPHCGFFFFFFFFIFLWLFVLEEGVADPTLYAPSSLLIRCRLCNMFGLFVDLQKPSRGGGGLVNPPPPLFFRNPRCRPT